MAEKIKNNVAGTLQYHLPFKAENGAASVCGISLVTLKDGRAVATVSELAENKGSSVTNSAEIIAAALCTRHNLPLSHLVIIEHYPEHADGDPVPTWDIVTFKCGRLGANIEIRDADWRPARHDDFVELGIDDPRRWGFDATEIDGGLMFEILDGARRYPDGTPMLAAWFCDRAEAHGGHAYARARDRLSMLYRKGEPQGPPFKAGDSVCFRLMPQAMTGGKLVVGRGEVEQFNPEPGIRNQWRVTITTTQLPPAIRPAGAVVTLGFSPEQLSHV